MQKDALCTMKIFTLSGSRELCHFQDSQINLHTYMHENKINLFLPFGAGDKHESKCCVLVY